ncbi:predicted protein [Nematostella vectensis]|uniref:G-protein coupled receptors family 1 profile domain-containing protein n=1 Tax=Nematostella vectensis TaxID=45351 RepID=A7SXX4_NEMVE|nr:predicted protein [Nematostella vectensis]|eukprot:XP_001623554.1 predicted protein [Nematostella vectensis]
METPIEIAVPLGIFSFLVIIENSVVLYLVLANRHMRTYTNGFVVSLASSDILTGLVIFCQYLIGFQNAAVINVAYAVVLISGAANITSVTLDRYLAITKPFKYTDLMRKYFKYITFITWTTSILLAVLPLGWYAGNITEVFHKVYVFITIGLGVITPYFFVLFANIRIYCIVRKSVKREKKTLSSVSQEQSSRRRAPLKIIVSEAKVARVFACTALAFAISWFPVLYYTIAAVLGSFNSVPNILVTLSPFFIVIGSLANPLIYSFMKPDFKIASRALLCKIRLVGLKRDMCVAYTPAKSLNGKPLVTIVAGTKLETASILKTENTCILKTEMVEV